MSQSEVIKQLSERFYNDAAGFSKAFTKIFNEQDGTEQKLYKKQVEFLNLLKPEEDIVTVVKRTPDGV